MINFILQDFYFWMRRLIPSTLVSRVLSKDIVVLNIQIFTLRPIGYNIFISRGVRVNFKF